jgi:rod shape-determining protein MreC
VIRIRRTLDRHRAAVVLALLLLAAALAPAGPFGLRARLAGAFSPLALLAGRAPPAPTPPAGERALREELARLEARARALETENAALKEFRGLRLEERAPGARVVAARTVFRDLRWPARRSLYVDRGSRDGLERGQPVIAGSSLVGFVVETSERSARVQLLDDPAPRADDPRVPVAVRILREGATRAAEGVLKGVRRGVLRVDLLPAGSAKPGDLVVTAPGDPRVPAGLLVGRVAAVDEDGQTRLATAEVAPSADPLYPGSLLVLVLPPPDAPLSRGPRR